MKIGIIGAGNIGGTLAKKLASAGHSIRLANSRGPETLKEIAQQTGGAAVSVAEAVDGVDVIIFSLPYKAFLELPADLMAQANRDAVVIDTGNYYPMRDGEIGGLDGSDSDSEWVAKRLGHPIVKAFNSISANSLKSKGRRGGMDERVALPVSGDDPRAKKIVMQLVDEAGFEPVDAGPLSESWRQQPGTGAYTTDLDVTFLQSALDRLDESDRKSLPERRESNLRLILSLPEGPGSDQSVRALRKQWNLPEYL